MAAAFAGCEPRRPCRTRLSDMAADAIGLLDHLGIERAHIMGASMGGMIVQTMAIEHPTRVRSLISVMSHPGELEVGQPHRRSAGGHLLAAAHHSRGVHRRLAEVDGVAVEEVPRRRGRRQLAARDYDRSFYPEGGTRQMAAIYASGRRTESLQQLDMPTLVIHGRDDTLITPSGGYSHRRARSRVRTCCSWPTWATTCPSRCGRSSPTPSSATPAMRLNDTLADDTLAERHAG